MKAETLVIVSGAVALYCTTVWGAYENTNLCREFEFEPEPCAKRLSAEGWRREFTLPSQSMDAGVYYDVWRKGEGAILCSSHWGRGRRTTMSCDLLQPVPVKN